MISGEARDTSIELRSTVGAAVVCEAAGSVLVLPPSATPGDYVSSYSTPEIGDTLWLLADTGAVEVWSPLSVQFVSTTTQHCVTGAPAPFITPGSRMEPRLVLDTGDPSAGRFPAGTPLRITRRSRYSLYRASDALWYLGYRDYNPRTARLNVIQPLSGPFLAPGAGGMAFRYFDGVGGAIASGSATVGNIALVEIGMRVLGSPALGAAQSRIPRSDSALIAVTTHNRH